MTVKVFVPHDGDDLELPPQHAHETWGAIDLIRRIWAAYADDLKFAVSVMANLDEPSADFVVVTNRGMGVVELKDVPGIVQLGLRDVWTYVARGSKPKRISGGRRNGEPRLNPHQQVQDYAEVIRKKTQGYLSGCASRNASDFSTNTAVCFTHPLAEIDSLKRVYDYYASQNEWERFQFLVPSDIASWIYAISFEVDRQVSTNEYERVHLNDRQVFNLPGRVFDLRESRSIERILEMNEPVGYLSLIENDSYAHSFGLYPGANGIGRDPKDLVSVPTNYAYVSRRHARVLVSDRGTFVQDLGSKHGTFVDGQQVDPDYPFQLIQKDHVITLCGPNGTADHVCTLAYTADLPPTAV